MHLSLDIFNVTSVLHQFWQATRSVPAFFFPVKAYLDSLGCIKRSTWSLFIFLWQFSEHFILRLNAQTTPPPKKIPSILSLNIFSRDLKCFCIVSSLLRTILCSCEEAKNVLGFLLSQMQQITKTKSALQLNLRRNGGWTLKKHFRLPPYL